MAAFNFQHFLEKMKEKSAFEIVTEIKGFIAEYSDKRLLPEEFVRVIRDFLDQTGQKLAVHELWRHASADELDNAYEGLEKYLMNKMYKACFQPAASDDVSKDMVLREKLSLMSFIRPEHLDIPSGWAEGDHIVMAQKELCRMDDYKAPRDKMVCVLNCCKIINNILQLKANKASGADEFFPMLVYVIISAKPLNLYSNMRFIQRFRNEYKLSGEPGYYFTTLQGAIEFVGKLSPENLTIDKEEFDRELNLKLQAMDSVTEPAVPPKPRASGANLIDIGGDSPSALAGKAPASTVPAQSKPSSDPFVRNPSYGNLISLGGESAESTPARAPAPAPPPVSSSWLGDFGESKDASVLAKIQSDAAAQAKPNGGPSLPLTADGPQRKKTGDDPAVMRELVAALREPPVNKFLTCSVEDLTMVDIPLLLSDYKRMVKLTAEVKTFLEEQGLA